MGIIQLKTRHVPFLSDRQTHFHARRASGYRDHCLVTGRVVRAPGRLCGGLMQVIASQDLDTPSLEPDWLRIGSQRPGRQGLDAQDGPLLRRPAPAKDFARRLHWCDACGPHRADTLAGRGPFCDQPCDPIDAAVLVRASAPLRLSPSWNAGDTPAEEPIPTLLTF